MIEVQVIASGSSGNCYRIKSGSSQLLLEAGIPIKKIKEAINWELGNIDGCLVTHEHMDHAKAADDLLREGVELFMSRGTAEALLLEDKVREVEADTVFSIGKWTIMPLQAQHDAAEPLAWLISDGEDKLLFATDTYYLNYKFTGLTLVMLECNYSDEILKQRMLDGVISQSQARRLLRSHFSLRHACLFFSKLDLSLVRQIWLLHISGMNGNPKLFETEIKKITGKPVRACTN